MMKEIWKSLVIGALVWWLVACSGTNPAAPGGNTPPEPVFGDLVLKMAAASGGVDRSNTQIGSIVIDEMRVVVEEINLEQVGSDDDANDFEGPFVGQLVENSAYSSDVIPDFSSLDLPFANYDTIKFKISKIQPDEFSELLLTDPLAEILSDQSIVISGQFLEAADRDIDGNSAQNYIPFTIISDYDDELEIRSADGFAISSDRVNYLFIALRVDLWFDGVVDLLQDLESEDLIDGVVTIDSNASDSLQDILDLFENNIDTSFRLASSDDDAFSDDEIDGSCESDDTDNDSGEFGED